VFFFFWIVKIYFKAMGDELKINESLNFLL